MQSVKYLEGDMMNFGKTGFDPGHYAGQNAGPGTYREGDVMLKLGLMLQQKYGSFLTRTDGKGLSFPVRAAKAKTAGCNTLISLHTNAPEVAKGILVLSSIKRSEDEDMAEYIGKELAKAMGISFRGIRTRTSIHSPTQDYYGMIRNPVNQGIEHVFIIEHGSHWEMAVDTDKKLSAIVECYGRILGLDARAAEIARNVGILFDNKIVTDKEKWIKKASGDSDVYWLIKNMANKLKKG
jgi:hypothetical protein